MLHWARFFWGRPVSLAPVPGVLVRDPLSEHGRHSDVVAVLRGVFGLAALMACRRDDARPSLDLGASRRSLFLAVLSRPTMAISRRGALAYVLVAARRIGISAAALLVVLMLAFAGPSAGRRSAPRPAVLRGRSTLQRELAAGSSRGSLAAHPEGFWSSCPRRPLLAVLAWLTRRHGRAQRRLSCWPSAGRSSRSWPSVGFPDWYGGSRTAPRLLTEVVPGLFPRDRPGVAGGLRTVAALDGRLGRSLAALRGVRAHGAGPVQPWTLEWNAAPRGTTVAVTQRDWRYPQFLHTETAGRPAAHLRPVPGIGRRLATTCVPGRARTRQVSRPAGRARRRGSRARRRTR